MDKRLEPVYIELARALARLNEGQGMVGRRNARAAVKKALKRLQDQTDKHYPTIRRKPKKRRAQRKPIDRLRHLKRNGWVAIRHQTILERLAEAGIRVVRVRLTSRHPNTVVGSEVLGPDWAVDLAESGLSASNLKSCKRNIAQRKAELVKMALKEDSRSKKVR